jgi:uncharacterized protein YjbI with pentapeptide repeats
MSQVRRIITLVSALTMASGLAFTLSGSAGGSNPKNARPTGVNITPIDTAVSVNWTGAIGSSTVNGYTVTATGPKHAPQSCLAENPTTSCIISGLVNGKKDHVSLQPGEVTDGPHDTKNFTPVGRSSQNIMVLPTTAQNCSYVGDFANLQGCNLSNAGLSGVFLDFADMAGTNLTNANLNGSNLAEANLQGAVLTGVNLSAAFFNATNLSNDTLTGLDLVGADFDNTDLAGLNMAGSDMNNAIVLSGDLDGTNLENINLVDGSIDDSSMVNADLSHANLANAQLANDNMTGAKFIGAKVSGINWINSTCPDGTSANTDGDTCTNNGG